LNSRRRAVKSALDAVLLRCDVVARREADPVGFAHRYTRREDRELVALVAACVAFGNVATIPAKAGKLEWLVQRTRPNDFFFQSGWPGLYLPLQLRNPIFIDDLDPRGVTPSEYVDSGMRQLEAKAVRYILWSPRLDSPRLNKVDNHLTKFHEYLETHYKQVHSFPDADQLWERRSGQ